MAQGPFQWFGNQAISTPEAAARTRAISEALAASRSKPAANWAEGLSHLTGAYVGRQLEDRAMAAEEAGRASAGEALAGLGPSASFEQISAALSNPWLSPAQSNIGAALLSQNLQRNDPMYQLQLQTAQAELDALRNPQPRDPTTAQQNYEYLLSIGVDPTAAQGMSFGGGGTTVNNLGNIPSGYEVFQDPLSGATQMRPIPGGPADVAAQAATTARDKGQAQVERYGNVVTEDIGRALEIIEADPTFTTGVVGQLLSGLGGTPANRVANLIETVESNVGFDRLQAMRESSPTGGALGSVTERELSLLTAAIGSLKQSNNAEDLAYNLRRVNGIYMDIIHGPGNWSSETPNSTSRRTSTGVEFSF